MNVEDLIDTIHAGKTLEIEKAFQEVFSTKVADAIEKLHGQLSAGLFSEAVDQKHIFNTRIHDNGDIAIPNGAIKKALVRNNKVATRPATK